MGLTVALTHNRGAEVLVRRIAEVFVVHGPVGVSAWMPNLSACERAGRRTGAIPGWRDTVRTLTYMGVDLEHEEEFPCTLDGVDGTSFMWPTPEGCRPLPFGRPAVSSWEEQGDLGFTYTVAQTGDQVNETPAIIQCYVAFHTKASVLELEEVGATR